MIDQQIGCPKWELLPNLRGQFSFVFKLVVLDCSMCLASEGMDSVDAPAIHPVSQSRKIIKHRLGLTAAIARRYA
jgi:hypothetical protein